MSAQPIPLHTPILAALADLDETPDTRCKAGHWLAGLDADEHEHLIAAVRRSTATTVHRTLHAHRVLGLPSETVWRRHWNGPCGCPQDAA